MSNKLLLGGIGLGVTAMALFLWISTRDSADPRQQASVAPAREAASHREAQPKLAESAPRVSPDLDARAPKNPLESFHEQMLLASESETPKTPEESKAIVLAALKQTGATTEAWTRDAGATFERIGNEMGNSGLSVQISGMECYAAGCTVDISYSQQHDHNEVTEKIATTSAVYSWQGPKMATPSTIGASGTASLNFILLRPQ